MEKLLETIEVETGKNPTAAVIWMHGLGADASDFVPVVNELGLGGAPAVRFVFPNAPMRPGSEWGSPIYSQLDSISTH